MSGPWKNKFVGSHLLLTEPSPQPNTSWNTIPESWATTRFDAIDVLFISPFHVKPGDLSLQLGDGVDLFERFNWVIRAARSKNPNIILILEQFYHEYPNGIPPTDFQLFNGDSGKINSFANTISSFIESYYNKTLPNISGAGEVSARIQGYDVDVESSTGQGDLSPILAAVRLSLDDLSHKLGSSKFSVSITPAWTNQLKPTIAQSCDYINMQNYSGGYDTFPDKYLRDIPGLKQEQLAWGFNSEEPDRNTPICKQFLGMKSKAQEVANGHFVGTYTWRINSDNHDYENIYQVWLYNLVHGTTLIDSKDESIVQKYWATGGRDGNKKVIPLQDLK